MIQKNNIVKIYSIVVSAILFTAVVATINNSVYAADQTEKMQLCWDYKEVDTLDTNRLLVNCAEFANSDYDTVEEFIAEEHPELTPE